MPESVAGKLKKCRGSPEKLRNCCCNSARKRLTKCATADPTAPNAPQNEAEVTQPELIRPLFRVLVTVLFKLKAC